MKTPCTKMGFTQKASCRPYKNCYKGGATEKTSTKVNMPNNKSKSKTMRNNNKDNNKNKGVRKTMKVNKPKMFYHSEHVSYISHPVKGKPFGFPMGTMRGELASP
jgi:hypothetical protein